MDPEIIGAASAILGTLAGGGIAIMARRGSTPPPPPPDEESCASDRCLRRVECINKYANDPDNYNSWLADKGVNYQTDCEGIPPSTDRLA